MAELRTYFTPFSSALLIHIEQVIFAGHFGNNRCEIPRSIEIKRNTGILPDNYLLKVNNKNTGIWCQICPKVTIKTPERRHWLRSGVFIVNLFYLFILFIFIYFLFIF